MQYTYHIDNETRFTIIFNLKQRQQQIDERNAMASLISSADIVIVSRRLDSALMVAKSFVMLLR